MMTESPLPARAITEAALRLGKIRDQIRDEIGSNPTLGELLDVIGWSIPVSHDQLDDVVALPLKFKVRLRGGKSYKAPRSTRIDDLNDSTFVAAADLLAFLIENVHATNEGTVSLPILVSCTASAVQAANLTLEDVSSSAVESMTIAAGRQKKRPAHGDIVAIPARTGGYHLAVVVGRDRFGTAFGLLRGTFNPPRIPKVTSRALRRKPIYSDDQLIATGVWKVVGHDEELISSFSAPEIYHRPDMQIPGVNLGEFGAAETPLGELRLIGRDEAQEIGLLDGRYRQTYLSEYLQDLLDNDAIAWP